MAPEQFSGGAASVKSDIYALGLILFEVFTGRRAQESKTLDELKRFHETGTHTTPSTIVHDIDPGVERVILRCLERDPERRPASALVVATALPGGDPLAAALAAAKHRPPRCGRGGRVRGTWRRPRAGARGVRAWRAAGLCCRIERTSLTGRTPLADPPAVLVDRAEQIVRSLGYTDPRGSGLRLHVVR